MHHLIGKDLDLETLHRLVSEKSTLGLSAPSAAKIKTGRKYLDEKLKKEKSPIYGINTGFGSLYNQTIGTENLGKLQENLVLSHACGTGETVPSDLVKLMLILKIQGLSKGLSGVKIETVQALIQLFNAEIYPVIYTQGSLGASGDLAPLAHLTLPLLGLSEVEVKGKKMSALDALKKAGLKPISFGAKEALALLNGTQFMSAYGIYCLIRAQSLCGWADIVGALSLEGFDGRPEPFSPLLHKARPHPGQIKTAANVLKMLTGSNLISRAKTHVQDPYSFRCIPQVHGATRDAVNYGLSVFLTEVNSVTDNPTLFPEEDQILSGGNFHGQPLAIALDFLAIALSELSSISERRTFQLISGQRGLPPFLVKKPGLNSGFMIPQYTAASIVSQNKQYCTPASVDSIVSSNGQEDHVSMGANAAVKCSKVAENVQTVLAIELLTAAQAMEFRRPARSSPFLERILSDFRKKVPALHEDRLMYKDIQQAKEFIARGILIKK